MGDGLQVTGELLKTRANTGHAVLRSTPKPPKKRRRYGPTDGWTDGRTDGLTDGQTLLQRCEDASKKSKV